MTLHWEAAPGPMREVLAGLSEIFRDSDFYLAGGTALALQEGHRISEDLDFFSPTFVAPERLLVTLAPMRDFMTAVSTSPRTVDLEIRGVQVSFFGYDYPLLAPLLRPEPTLLPLAHPDDIGAMKLAAVASRGSRKDFVDVWLLVQRNRPLAEFVERFSAKFATRDIGHIVRSLVYFDDADNEPPLRMLIDVTWERVKADLGRWVRDLMTGS